MYRPEIRVLDCTIRDGGLINNHKFSMEMVQNVYRKVSAAGVDYCELGYKNSRELFDSNEFGAWKFCDDEDIKRVIDGVENGAKVSVMADVGRVDMDNVLACENSPVDMVRTATYVHDVDKGIAMVNEFADRGYETCLNIMAISRDRGPELEEALHQVEEECKAKAVYIVDSFGSLYQEPTAELVKRFKAVLKTKEVGMHMHNNQQMAFSNTIEGIINGANYLDATVYGIGRGAGNATLELLLGFLKNPKFDIRPILDLIQEEFISLREEIEWGYLIPYAIGGIQNEHPRTAISWLKSEKRNEFREYWDSLQQGDEE